MLSLGIVSMVTGQKLTTTVEALKNYFDQEELEKHCDEDGCGAVHATSSSCITFHPQLLILQYKRFLGPGNKVKHHVQGVTDLSINRIMYGLVGLMLHLGEEMATGHYMAVSR